MKATILSLLLLTALFMSGGAAYADTWTTITSGWRPTHIVSAAGDIWASSEGGLLHIPASTNQLRVLNVDDGLFSNDIAVVEKDEQTGFLWLGHRNAGVQVYDPQRRRVIQTIRDFFSEPAVQTIHDIYAGPNGVYVATDQGLSKMMRVDDEDRWVVQETYRAFGSWPSPTAINQVELRDGMLYAAGSRGVASASTGDNLLNVNSWTVTPVSQFVPGANEGTVRFLSRTRDTLYLAFVGSALYRFDDAAGWVQDAPFYTSYNVGEAEDGTLYVAAYDGIFRRAPGDDSLTRIDDSYTPKFFDVVVTEDGELWGAIDTSNEYFGGLAHWTGLQYDLYFPNTPGGDQILRSTLSPEGHLWLAARSSRIIGVYEQVDGGWRPWSKPNAPQGPWNTSIALTDIEFDPHGGTWIGSFGTGVYYIRPMAEGVDSLFHFDALSSPLGPVDHNGNFVVATGFESGRFGGLWVSNLQAHDSQTLHYIPQSWFLSGPDDWNMNSWVPFGPEQGNTFRDLTMIEMDAQGRLWLASNFQDADEPLVIYDPGDLPMNTDDDEWYYPNSLNTSIEFTNVNVMEIADDGTIWFGTNNGLFYADSNLPIDQIRLTRINGALGQAIRALDIDPLGQVWVGTDFGVSVLGRDRFTWIAQYTSEDGSHPSELVDDAITTITVDRASGEVYIGTRFGLSVLSTPYREFGSEVSDVVVAPQPFLIGEPGARLQFSRVSLVADASVRLYTPSGRLARTLSFAEASGGGWDGRDDDGDLVGSGVYYIVVTDPNGQSTTGKVAVVRQ